MKRKKEKNEKEERRNEKGKEESGIKGRRRIDEEEYFKTEE